MGRKAGLGQAVADADPGLAIAWATATELPVYYEWYFRTGAAGDFESMVRALKPRPIDKRVGIRDLDIQQPGFMMPPIASPPDDVVGLEGAILAPTSEPKPLSATSNFGPAIETIVNLAADVEQSGVAGDGAGNGDPVVTAPLYGRWHALVQRISADPAHANWVNALNVDPRYRAAAGFGTRVIQKNQESYMQRAWAQIGDVLAANRRVQAVQLATHASQRLHERTFAALADERALAIAAPVLAKVKASPVTLRAMVDRSALPRSALSGAFRKALRPRGALARRIVAATPVSAPRVTASRLGQAIAALNAGQVSAAPPRSAPPGMTLERIADVLAQTAEGRANADALLPKALSVAAVKAVPPRPVFDIPRRSVPLEAAPDPAERVRDSPAARAFRGALVAFHEQLSVRTPAIEPRAPLALAQVRSSVQSAIEPLRAFPVRISPLLRIGGVPLSDYVRDRYHDRPHAGTPPAPPRIATVMAYPDIRDAMYAPLASQSSELLVPNLKLVAPNTISLMIKNQPFIEAYMAGLNHEFARELLWREYPTDQRPSTFRQFWDVSHVANLTSADPVAFEESLRDITPLHEWSVTSNLGEHDNRRSAGDPPETADTPLSKRAVILVVRGDLLKRYPNTVIYAQRATWGTRADNALRLTLWDETGEKSDTADPNIRYPQYRAFVAPDLHFVGFDLSVEEVRGDPALAETAEAKAQIPAAKLGWFFVLKEVVGEPRFGLDETPPDAPGAIVWDNLSWANLGTDVTVIDLAKPFASEPGGTDRENVAWGASAADMAFILYQKPVLVAVHARDMLRDLAA